MLSIAIHLFAIFCLLLFGVGPIVALLKRLADDAGAIKKLSKTYALLFLAGCLCGPIAGLTEYLADLLVPCDGEPTFFSAFWEAFCVASFHEETLKFLCVLPFVVYSKRFVRYVRGPAYAAFVSMGFALVENVLYIFEGGLETAFFRSFTALLGHFAFSIYMGWFLALAVLGNSKRQNIFQQPLPFKEQSDKRKKTFYKRLALAWFVPFLLHGFYDFFLMFASTDSQLSGASLVAWLFFFIASYWFAKELIDRLKLKDAALKKDDPRALYYK